MPAKKQIDETAFAEDHAKLSIAELCRKYSSCESSVREWARKLKLPMKRLKVTLVAGQKIGSWTVIERTRTAKFGCIIWKVQCDCGKIRHKTTGHIVYAAANGYRCGCNKWTGCGDMSGKYWKSVIQKARERGINVEITAEMAWKQFLVQNRRCALTGVELVFATGTYQTASLDRIDSNLGYIPTNIQWVHKHINRMKNRFNTKEFIECCRRVVVYQDGKN